MSNDPGAGEEFRPILKARARGPAHLDHLEPQLCEKAMELILYGEATPVQIGGFLLVGRAYGDSPEELAAYARAARSFAREIDVPGPPTVTVTGGFDGKLRTLNISAAASLLAAAAGGRTLMLGCEGTPPKAGRTIFDALRGLLIPSPHTLQEAELSLTEHGFAATSPDHYLPELYALLGLRWEMVRRTALNVVEKLVSPILGSRFLVGITHRPFLESVPAALMDLAVEHALVFQAIEGSDEAPLDGSSALVRVCGDEVEELRIQPESLGLSRATKAHIPWKGEEDEARCLLGALAGEEGAVHDLILYNAALRLWVADWDTRLADHLEIARAVLSSGRALELIDRLCGRVPASRGRLLTAAKTAGYLFEDSTLDTRVLE
ncbi:MAG: anthranilate phosphoribosyltransferase [Rubrobacteraceae bacterium]|nr:anthranilate phosphoribosyltransferase [Rubrobacteraceae bacterium]